MPHEILTAEEVATYLRLPESEVERLARDGQIPCIRMGPFTRFTRESLELWIRKGMNSANEPSRGDGVAQVEGVRGRNHSRLVENGKCVEITLDNPRTPLEYTLIPVQRAVRRFFPGYRVPFIIRADGELIRTHVTSAAGNPRTGDPLAGHYCRDGLKGWFGRHRREIRPGVCLRLRMVEAQKEYSLEIIDSAER